MHFLFCFNCIVTEKPHPGSLIIGIVKATYSHCTLMANQIAGLALVYF